MFDILILIQAHNPWCITHLKRHMVYNLHSLQVYNPRGTNLAFDVSNYLWLN